MNAIDLCNNALALLCEPPISGIDPNGNLSQRMCYLHYHPVRRETLCLVPWLFAVHKTTLDTFATEDPDGCAIPHTIPNDAIRIWKCNAPGWTQRNRQIFARPQKIEIEYTSDEENLDLWSADALHLFTHMLAAKICIPLINNPTLRNELLAKHGAKLQAIQQTNPKS